MKAARTTLFSLALLLLAAADTTARQQSLVEPGDRIRIRLDDGRGTRVDGFFVEMRADTLIVDVQPADADSLQRIEIPWSLLDRVLVSRGFKNRAVPGAVGGFVVGAGIGALVGMFSESAGDFATDQEVTEAALVGAAIGSVLGGAAGLVIGLNIKVEQWERLPLNRIQISVQPGPSAGLLLAASFRF